MRPGTVYLFQTKDGGHSWEKSQIAAPAGYEQAELETTGPIFLSTSTAYLPVHVSSQNGILLAVYVTHDGGTAGCRARPMSPKAAFRTSFPRQPALPGTAATSMQRTIRHRPGRL